MEKIASFHIPQPSTYYHTDIAPRRREQHATKTASIIIATTALIVATLLSFTICASLAVLLIN